MSETNVAGLPEECPECGGSGGSRSAEGDWINCGTCRDRAIATALSQAQPAAPKCDTCSDHGMIGGPSFYAPDEGGVPCPDCSKPAAAQPAGSEVVGLLGELEVFVRSLPVHPSKKHETNELADRIVAARRSCIAPPAAGAVPEVVAKEAARYRYLRRPEAWKEDYMRTPGGVSAIFVGDGSMGHAVDTAALDEAVDRAMLAAAQKEVR